MARQRERDRLGPPTGLDEEADRGWRNTDPARRLNPESPAVAQSPASGEAEDTDTSLLVTPQTVGASFKAISFTNLVPPDSMGDVGPTQILAIANNRIRAYSKAGVLGALDADTDVFFSSVTGSGTSDPHIRYDRLSGRWFVVMIDTMAVNHVLLAVSSGPVITGSSSFTFFGFRFDTVGPTPNADTNQIFDYPTLGVDRNALYIGGVVLGSGVADVFIGTTVFVVNKAGLLSGTLTVTAFRQLVAGPSGSGPDAPQGVHNDDPFATEGYFIGPDHASFGRLMIRRVSDPGGVPSMSGNIALTVPSTSKPLPQVAKSSVKNLAAVDDRLFAAAIHQNRITSTRTLWTAHNIAVTSTGVGSSSGTRNGSRWYEIANLQTTPTLVQSGTLFDPATASPRGYWMPSVAATGQGHMVLGSSYAGTNDFAGVAASGRLRFDKPGATRAPTLAVVSDSAYNHSELANPVRWGDFSQTSVDPADDQTVWTFQEYCDAANIWGVRAIQLLAPPPATPSSATSSCTGQGATDVIVTGNAAPGSGEEFFEPGPDVGGPGYASHISAAVTGGVVVIGATFVDPTHVVLNIDTTAATVGTKDVTVINPDGQRATGDGILSIVPPPSSPVASSSGTICAGASLQLFASTVPGAAYAWTGPNGFASSLQNPVITGATPAASGVYRVAAIANGCRSMAATTVAGVMANGEECSDGNACTGGDVCSGGVCSGTAVSCDDGNPCTADLCGTVSGCAHVDKAGPCSDRDPCTENDVCAGGACTGVPVTAPGETMGLRLLADRQTIQWDPVAGTYDVPRGLVSELPVGSGASEVCLASNLAATSTSDPATPATGAAFWYLVRAANACGNGVYGHDSEGAAEVTPVCP